MKQVTNLKEYVKEGLFYEAVVEDGSDIIFIVNYAGDILYHNPSTEETLGHPPKSLIGKKFFDYIMPDSRPHLEETFRMSTSKPYDESIEFRFRCDNGSYKYLEFNSINLKHKAGVEGLILDCRDISERKKDAEELLRAQKAKEQFLANMSHEIRTPVNGISGMINLLMQSDDEADKEQYLNAIKNSTESLKVIINDILDLSAIESGKLKFEKIGFSVKYQLSAVLDTFLYQSKDKGIELNYHIEPEADVVFLGDPARLNQILINLVSNAVKFTHVGQISIHVAVVREDILGKHIQFKVHDTGVGISQKKIHRIFDSFTQADASVTRRYGGTGLGLTIVKELIEMQQGTITVDSEENVGTTFTFTIPYQVGKDEDLVHPKSSDFQKNLQHSLKGLNILLVEDNDVNRLYANSILDKWDCTTETAENGLIAYEMSLKKLYDVILMDVQMPIMDGYEATRKIRTIEDINKRYVPIIALTANAIKGDVDKCKEAGMNDYISKPFHPETLYRAITKFVDPESLSAEDPPPLKLTDLSYLNSVSNGDTEFVKEMLRTFIANTPEIINEMESLASNANWKEVASRAHKIKPSITFIGLERAKSIVHDIEEFSQEGRNTEQIKDKVRQLSKLCKEAMIELKQSL